jgi:hypothetical protein
VIQFGNKFYWYGTQYGKTNGFTNANKYVSYSSKNLTNWTFEGELIQNRPDGVYYRPHVVFNIFCGIIGIQNFGMDNLA